MAYAIAGPAQGLAPRRAIEIGELFAARFPSFEAAVAFIRRATRSWARAIQQRISFWS